MRFDRFSLKKFNFFSIIMLIISLTFYLFFAFYDGAVICVDSPSYIEMNIAREPLYPIFLALCRFIFSHFNPDFYLTAAIFLQSILAAIAAWCFARYFSEEFHLTRLFSMLILLMPLFVSFLCRFAAKRGSMYSNSILTEGITISCYLLFFRYIFEYLLHQTKQSLLFSCILTFLLISTRKQMIISLFILIVCMLIVFYKEKKFIKGIITIFLSTLCIILCSTLLDLGYNHLLRGEAVTHSGDTRFITTVAFYTADRTDSKYIEDSEVENLFLQIYDICDQNGYLLNSAGDGWLNRVSHFGDYYDCIQIDTMWPLVNEFAKEHYSDDVINLNENADRVMNIINYSIIPHNLSKIFKVFIDNFISGLITTVAQRNIILIWYSLFIYLLYIALLIFHIRKKNSPKIVLFSILTLISILFNVGLVSLVIFCQTRYTIYNMALFYISLLLMLYEPFTKVFRGRTHAV